jgi:hypothetical protein
LFDLSVLQTGRRFLAGAAKVRQPERTMRTLILLLAACEGDYGACFAVSSPFHGETGVRPRVVPEIRLIDPESERQWPSPELPSLHDGLRLEGPDRLPIPFRVELGRSVIRLRPEAPLAEGEHHLTGLDVRMLETWDLDRAIIPEDYPVNTLFTVGGAPGTPTWQALGDEVVRLIFTEALDPEGATEPVLSAEPSEPILWEVAGPADARGIAWDIRHNLGALVVGVTVRAGARTTRGAAYAADTSAIAGSVTHRLREIGGEPWCMP